MSKNDDLETSMRISELIMFTLAGLAFGVVLGALVTIITYPTETQGGIETESATTISGEELSKNFSVILSSEEHGDENNKHGNHGEYVIKDDLTGTIYKIVFDENNMTMIPVE